MPLQLLTSFLYFISDVTCWNYLCGPRDIGMSRLILSNADKKARDWFVETTKSLGCKVKVGAMGLSSKTLKV
jgi:hypothetical protein